MNTKQEIDHLIVEAEKELAQLDRRRTEIIEHIKSLRNQRTKLIYLLLKISINLIINRSIAFPLQKIRSPFLDPFSGEGRMFILKGLKASDQARMDISLPVRMNG